MSLAKDMMEVNMLKFHFSIRNLVIVLFVQLLCGAAHGEQIKYSFEGVASFSLNDEEYIDQPFKITTYGDTDNLIYIPAFTQYAIDGMQGEFSIEPFPPMTITYPIQVSIRQSTGDYHFRATDFNTYPGFGFDVYPEPGSGLGSYDLTTEFGPLTSTDVRIFPQRPFLLTETGEFRFTSMSAITFTSHVPEPNTFGIFVLSLLMKSCRRCRR
jgi:hypothetical protein